MNELGRRDSDTLYDLHIFRDLIRNAPLATGAINTICTNVVGTGPKLQSNRPEGPPDGYGPLKMPPVHEARGAMISTCFIACRATSKYVTRTYEDA